MDHIERIARVCHQAMKAFCETYNDFSIPDWEEAEEWQRRATYVGVEHRLAHPKEGFDAQHVLWMQEKLVHGWVYGETKDADKKTHPCLVPFDELPLFQQQKDILFCMIVDGLKGG